MGMPEARIILAQAAVYVACAPKSNSPYMAVEQHCQKLKMEKWGMFRIT